MRSCVLGLRNNVLGLKNNVLGLRNSVLGLRNNVLGLTLECSSNSSDDRADAFTNAATAPILISYLSLKVAMTSTE